jgi:hypothetical protein
MVLIEMRPAVQMRLRPGVQNEDVNKKVQNLDTPTADEVVILEKSEGESRGGIVNMENYKLMVVL